MTMDTQQLLQYLMRGGTHGHYWRKHGDVKETLWWPGATPPPVPDEWAGSEIYFGVNPTFEVPERNSQGELTPPHLVRSRNNIVQAVSAIISDMDAKDYTSKNELAQHIMVNLPLRPSLVVDSGGGYHGYWLLQQPVGPGEAEKVQRGWPGLVGGDPAAKDLARVLRIPGTLNHKYDPTLPVKIVWQCDKRYTLEELRKVLDAHVEAGQSEDAPPPRFFYDGQRNRDLLTVAGALARQGATEEVIYAALKARSVEQHRPPLDDSRIRKIAGTANWPKEPEMLGAPANDEGNAQCFVLLFGGQFLFADHKVGWLFYNGKYWERNEYLAQYCMLRTLETRKLAVKRTNNYEAHKDVYAAAKEEWPNIRDALQLAKLHLVAKWVEFDKHPDLLNCANGVLNLRTGDLVPHSHGQRFTYCIETGYDEGAECLQWLKFLDEVLIPEGGEDEGVLDYIQLALGYTLTGLTSEECLFYLTGPTRGGKGTFVETIRTLLGSHLSAEVAFDSFAGRRRAGDQNFDLAPLKTCRFLAASEGERTTKLNAAFINRITGGNSIRAAFKYETPFDYRPMYKIWLSSNYAPKSDPSDNAVWGRFRVIPFPNSFLGREDKHLKARLRRPGELRGILAWLVEGAMRWYKLGGEGLKAPQRVRKAVDEARDAVDYVKMWADACLEDTGNPKDFVVSSHYHKSYDAWYREEGIGPLRYLRGQVALTRDLRRLGYELTTTKKTDSVTGVRGRALVGYRVLKEITIGGSVV